MIKNLFSVLIFLFIFLFIFFTILTYISVHNKKKINLNRKNVFSKIEDHTLTLPLLKNDTQDVIEFNSGYNNAINKKKRNFWNLLKND